MMPRLVLGGRFGQVPVELSFRLLDQFRAAGGRMLETAHSYANGDAERVLGAWLRSRRCRDTVTVVDKVGHPAPGEEPSLQPDVIRREVADSLRRLGTAASMCSYCTATTRATASSRAGTPLRRFQLDLQAARRARRQRGPYRRTSAGQLPVQPRTAGAAAVAWCAARRCGHP